MRNLVKAKNISAQLAIALILFVSAIIFFVTFSAPPGFAVEPLLQAAPEGQAHIQDACDVESITKLQDGGVRIWSPNGQHYLVNKKDQRGDYQIYVGTADGAEPVCITCKNMRGAPAKDRNKMQANWHPSGKWIVYAGEKLFYNEIWLPKRLRQGFLECGVWMDIYAISPDGSQGFKLADTKGFTGVAFTPDGKRGVWAEAQGMVPGAVFGKWKLKIADWAEKAGRPLLDNIRDITPPGAVWLEPGTFSPNGVDVALNSDIGMKDAQGQDQYILNVDTGELRNLTNSPKIWDEHGVFSPDGQKLVFMSSYPYRDRPNSYKILGLKVDFMLIDADGTSLRQITHFNTPGSPEFYKEGSTPAVGLWSDDGRSIDALVLLAGKRFPDYDVWRINFRGPCGKCTNGSSGN